jgi:hypothetical protein
MLLRLTLYATLGLVLDAVGQGFDTRGFWCVVGLFWAAEHITRTELLEQIHREVAEWRRLHPEQAQQLDNNNKDTDQ